MCRQTITSRASTPSTFQLPPAAPKVTSRWARAGMVDSIAERWTALGKNNSEAAPAVSTISAIKAPNAQISQVSTVLTRNIEIASRGAKVYVAFASAIGFNAACTPSVAMMRIRHTPIKTSAVHEDIKSTAPVRMIISVACLAPSSMA